MIIHTERDFEGLREEWNALADRFSFPTLSHEWHAGAMASLSGFDRAFIVVNRDGNGRVNGIAPLIRRSGARHLSFLASARVSEPSAFLYRDLDALRQLLARVRKIGLPLRLSRAPVTPFIDDVRRSNSTLDAPFFVSDECGSPMLPLRGDWSAFERSLSSRRRSDLRRALRRAEASGRISFDVLTPGEDEVGEVLGKFLETERQSWKGRERSALVYDAATTEFFFTLATRMAERGTLRVGVMRIGTDWAAAQIGLEHARAFWVLKIAHRECFNECSPGILLMHQMIRYAFEKNLQQFEFLGIPDAWIAMWTSAIRPYVTLRMYPFSISSTSVLCTDVWQAIQRRLPIGKGKEGICLDT